MKNSSFSQAKKSSWSLPGVKAFAIVSIRDVDAFVSCNRMRVDGRGRVDAVLPLFLHFGVHHQQRVVRQMDRDLAFGIAPHAVSLSLVSGSVVLVIASHDLPNAEFPGNAEADAADRGSWTKVC